MLTNQFELIHDELCRCDWYLCPIDMQRMVLIVLANTQWPKIVQGFGNVQCTRDSFKKVKWHHSCVMPVMIFELILCSDQNLVDAIGICVQLICSNWFSGFNFFFRQWMQASLISWHFVALMDKLVEKKRYEISNLRANQF